jgi:hypothetical protein
MSHSSMLNLTVRTITMRSALQFIDGLFRNLTLPACIVHLNPEKVYRV